MTENEFVKSIRQLRKLKNIHANERCFIIGNGPSLNKMDLSLLRNELTFGLNRIYLLFPKLNFSTTYHVTVNKLVVEQFAQEILARVPSTKFISFDARHWITDTSNVIYLYSRNGPNFYSDITKGIWQGATVTYTAMQIAYFMGFSQVILIGVDHNFSTKGQPHESVISQAKDTNHFDPNYFGNGVRWQLPDLKTSEVAYRLAKERFSRAGREILDATINGNLKIFPKVNYYSFFE
jgi:hypothetical protein